VKRLPPAARERALLGGYLFYRGGCLLDFGGFPAGAAAFTSYCSLLRFQTKCHHKGLGLSKQDKPRSLGQLLSNYNLLHTVLLLLYTKIWIILP